MSTYFSIHAAPTRYTSIAESDKRRLPFRGDVLSILETSTPPTPSNVLVYVEITDAENSIITEVAPSLGSGAGYAVNDVLTLVGGTGTPATLEVAELGGTQATILVTATAGTGALTSVEIIDSGYGYWTDGVGVAQAGGDGTIDYTVANGSIVSVSINAAGTANNDGSYNIATTPSAITAVNILNSGNYTVLPTGVLTTTGGTGSGAQFTILGTRQVRDIIDHNVYRDWRRGVEITLTGSDAVNDDWGITTTITNVPTAGDPYITLESVERFAHDWNGTITDITATSVTVNGSTYNFVTSPAFWSNTGNGFIDVQWAQSSYTSAPVVQTIVANYGDFNAGTSPNETAIRFERMAQDLTGDVSANGNLAITVAFDGDDVLDRFISQTRRYFEGTLAAHRYYIASATVDTIISSGGIVGVTWDTFQTYLLDKATTGQIIS